jgi:hypothetical protein
LETQLKLGKAELGGLRDELGAVYDKWARENLEKGMGKVTLSDKVSLV